MGFIQREIERNRGRKVWIRLQDATGTPIPGARLSVEQTTHPFVLGVVWEEGDPPNKRALSWLAHLGATLLVQRVPSPEFSVAIQQHGVPILSGFPAEPLVVEGISYPRLYIPELQIWGIDLSFPTRERWHLARLRRILLKIATLCDPFLVYGVQMGLREGEEKSRSFILGGEERLQADRFAEWMTLCFSIPQIAGFFCYPLLDTPPLLGLLRSDGSPRRVFKILRALLQHEWRTRVHGQTDQEGRFLWWGFHGTYRWSVWTPQGESIHGEAELPPGPDPCVWSLTLSKETLK